MASAYILRRQPNGLPVSGEARRAGVEVYEIVEVRLDAMAKTAAGVVRWSGFMG